MREEGKGCGESSRRRHKSLLLPPSLLLSAMCVYCREEGASSVCIPPTCLLLLSPFFLFSVIGRPFPRGSQREGSNLLVLGEFLMALARNDNGRERSTLLKVSSLSLSVLPGHTKLATFSQWSFMALRTKSRLIRKSPPAAIESPPMAFPAGDPNSG